MAVWDFVVIGAGMAGASMGWQLAGKASVLVLEREPQPGYHTTGRSAALFMETYGTQAIRALTRASRAFYDAPPPGFADSPILSPRGVVYVATHDQLDLLERTYQELRVHSPGLTRLTREELLARLPCLRPEVVAAGLSEPGAADIDVNALLQGYLRGLRQRGGQVRTNAEVTRLAREDGVWTVTLAGGETVQARYLVNAAGAWADVVAQLAGAAPVGLTPCRRVAFTFPVPPGMDAHGWPAAIGVDEGYYFKPDAGQLLGSPANADPMPPHDVVPEELDVATGIWRIEEVTTFQIRRPTHTWAGLRSFVADGDFVIGWDQDGAGGVEGFFWLAAQGGYGIQSAAGYALLARNLALGEPLDPVLQAEGVGPEVVAGLSPRRLR